MVLEVEVLLALEVLEVVPISRLTLLSRLVHRLVVVRQEVLPRVLQEKVVLLSWVALKSSVARCGWLLSLQRRVHLHCRLGDQSRDIWFGDIDIDADFRAQQLKIILKKVYLFVVLVNDVFELLERQSFDDVIIIIFDILYIAVN
jgi:hypothetical protein